MIFLQARVASPGPVASASVLSVVSVLVAAKKKADLAAASASDSEKALENSAFAVAMLLDPATESATANSPSALVIVSTLDHVSVIVKSPSDDVATAPPLEWDDE